MTVDEKLDAILAAVQIDPGSRGLARDPHDNLFTACRGDFAAACRAIVDTTQQICLITGFPIPTGEPPTFETDGPLGAFFLARALRMLGICEAPLLAAEAAVQRAWQACREMGMDFAATSTVPPGAACVAIERAGPAADGHCYSMRGRVLDPDLNPEINRFLQSNLPLVAIGDGGNELGMGKIPHETIVRNIPDGGRIHCRVPAEHLIVAGVSNWGAYALAAGLFVLRGESPPADLFDPACEKNILDIMVREGPLVDGVTGKQSATVDGLSWEEYIAPLNRIREIMT